MTPRRRRGRTERGPKPSRDTIISAYRSADRTATFRSVGKDLGISGEWVRQSVLAWEAATGETLPRWPRKVEEAPRPQRSLAQRLLSFVEVNPKTQCWEWTGANQTNPQFDALGEHYAYRVAYVMWCGPIPEGHVVKKTCRNGRCINPWHLEALPLVEAMRQYGRQKPRPRAPKTHCAEGHEFTPENTIENVAYVLRDGVRVRTTQRLCRICREQYLKGRKPAPPVSRPPPLRTIRDSDERELERIIRKAIDAPRARRLSTMIELLREDGGWGDWIIEYRPAQGEGWFDFLRRTRWKADRLEWTLCRMLDDPRVQTKILAIAGEITDPLLRREIPFHLPTAAPSGAAVARVEVGLVKAGQPGGAAVCLRAPQAG